MAYVTSATTKGGRNGRAMLDNGALALAMAAPKEIGGAGDGHNPEQLFALGYSSCYGQAILLISKKYGLDGQAARVTCDVTLDQKDGGFGLAVLRCKGITRLADRRALLVEPAHDPRIEGDAAIGAKHLYRHFRRGVFGRYQRMRRRRALEDRQAAIADRLAQTFQEFRSAPGIDAVREPGDLAVAGGFQETLDSG